MADLGNTLKLDLNEENELSIQMTIQGSDPELSETKSKVRLVITEVDTNKAWLYACDRDDEGSVRVAIPPSPTVFSEKAQYKGHLEVIIGNHYFVPSEFGIEFIRPLKVEAAGVSVRTKTSSGQPQQLRESPSPDSKAAPSVVAAVSNVAVRNTKKPLAEDNKQDIDDLLENIEKSSSSTAKQPPAKQKPAVLPTSKPKKKWEELTKEEQARVKTMVLENKMKVDTEEKRKFKERLLKFFQTSLDD